MGTPDTFTLSDRESREAKLKAIKNMMDKLGPAHGNFHIWYYGVYQLRKNGKLDMYRQAIEEKYKGLGLSESEQQ